jgi:serine phosphatase RsbU (regulator of sigma subunit)
MDIVLCEFSKNNFVRFACANNPLWLIRNNEFIEFHPDKFPVGIHHSDLAAFSLKETALQKGDMLYLISDGYADQFGGDKGKKFKYKPLKELLLTNVSKSCSEQKKTLSTVFESWRGNLEQVDDVLIIGIRI